MTTAEQNVDSVPEGTLIRRSRWLAITAIMTALALVGNYALVAIPNVELGSCILFTTAYVFGLVMAVWCTLMMSVLFSVFNPWGSFVPQIWFSQLLGWLLMDFVAAIMGHNTLERQKKTGHLELGIVGAVVTVFFDLITDLGFSWTSGLPYTETVIIGLPFMIVHVTSNAIIFGTLIPSVDYIIRHSLRSRIWEQTVQEMPVLSEG